MTQPRAWWFPVHPLLAGRWLLAAALAAAPVRAQGPAAASPAAPGPPSGLTVADVPNDAGTSLALAWKLSPDDVAGRHVVSGYQLERATSTAGPWEMVDSVAAGTTTYADGGVHRNTPYFYRVAAYGPGGLAMALANAGPGIGRETWFNSTRVSVLAFMLVFYLLVMFFMERARTGHKPFVRVIRQPWFGRLGRVAELPAELAALDTEARVRVLVVEFADDRTRATVPRANVERLAG